MRKICFIFLILLIAPALAASASASDLMDRAVREISTEMIESLPEDPHVRLIAVTEIKGDDGRITRNLTEALQSHKHYVLVERNKLEQIVEEHGFQVSDLASRDQRVEPGEIKGVEGVVFGEVLEKSGGPMSAKVKVFLQLDNVASGDIILAKEFTSTVEAPYRDTVYGFVALAVVLAALGLFFNSRARARARAKNQTAWSIRQQAAENLNQITSDLREVHGSIRAYGPSQANTELENLEFEAGRLRDRLQSGRMGQGMGKDTRKLISSDKKIAAAAKAALDASKRLLKKSRDAKPEGINSQIAEVKKKLDELSDKINQRP